MGAPKGNRFWKARASHKGHAPAYESPEDLWGACQQYFEWVEKNPLEAAETVKFQGSASIVMVPKMRAMTIEGLCRFIGITSRAWRDWRQNRKDVLPVITQVEEIMFEQKFTGAAADLLNPNIIARDLGLVDRSSVESKVRGELSINPEALSTETMEELLAARLIDSGAEAQSD